MARSSRISRSVKVYRVGGSVRDELLGRAITDRDWVVVGATPEILLASGYKPVGRDFPVFLHPDTREEFALARTERKHGRGYRGFEFFVSPDVTLDEDLARRDLTINAMARDERGTLIDPFGGAADLEARVLRHVSPAFVEDPLRVLRVARFAARFGFAVAPETAALMRRLVASGELAELAPERVWQELSRGLMEAHPSRMLAVLHDCGALAGLLPEVGALFAARRVATPGQPIDPGTHVARALDFAAAKAFALTVRYAILAGDLGVAESPASGKPKGHPRAVRNVRLAERVSRRLRAPVDCRDAARLAGRWLRVVHRAADLRAAALLDLLIAADALRRPERLDALLGACESDARSWPGAEGDYEAARVVRAALAIVKDVDAAAVARGVMATRKVAGTERADAVGKAVRAARLRALRDWRRSAALPLRKASSA